MVAKLGLAAFLLAHALIHVGFLVPRPSTTADGPPWPFDVSRSWGLNALGLGADAARFLALGLVALTVGAFGLAALAALGLAPGGLLPAAVVMGAASSSAILVVFFHPWLLLGLAIDAALLWLVLIAQWAPDAAIS
jgi:hypothetical protein